MKKLVLLAAAMAALGASAARNAYCDCCHKMTPLEIGLFTPVQLPCDDYDVAGIRLDLYGTCHCLDGVDLGLAGVARNHANGLIANLLTYVPGDGSGLALGAFNYFGGNFTGVELGLANIAGDGALLQFGLLNRSYDVDGVQFGLVNVAEHLDGVQFGLFNRSYDSRALQLGLVNSAERLSGVQIGLLNIIRRSEYPVLPILNIQ